MREVTLKDGTGLFVHDEDEALSDQIVSEENYYEIEILEYLAKNYPTHNVILDVGANIGNHTVFFAKNFVYKQILSFEPIPENFNMLWRNTENLLNVYPRRQAIGDGEIDIMMALNPENMGACQVTPTGNIPVHQTKIDNIFVQEISLIKIDVEWYEPFVLLGAKNTIEQDKPLILIEDSNQEYGDLLPNYYKLIESWPKYRTYLYGGI